MLFRVDGGGCYSDALYSQVNVTFTKPAWRIKSIRDTKTQKSVAHFLINCVIENFLASILKIQIAINLLPISEINFKNV